MKLIVIALLMFLCCTSIDTFAQRKAPWYINTKYKVDFSTGNKPQISYINNRPYDQSRPNFSYKVDDILYDYMGNFLIYNTFPYFFYDEQMDSIPAYNLFTDSLFNDHNDHLNRVFQNTLFQSFEPYIAEKDNKYYKFHLNQYTAYVGDSAKDNILAEFSKQNGGVYYTRIVSDGRVISKVKLDSFFGTKQLTNMPVSSIISANKSDGGYWLIAKTWNGTFYSYPIDSDNIGMPIISVLPQKDSFWQDYKFGDGSTIERIDYSEKSKTLISIRTFKANSTMVARKNATQIWRYDFDHNTGLFTLNTILLDTTNIAGGIGYYGCFTPDDSFYIFRQGYSANDLFTAFNVYNGTYASFKSCDTQFTKLKKPISSVNLGSDGNLYFCWKENKQWSIGKINYPFDTCPIIPYYVSYKFLNFGNDDIIVPIPPNIYYTPHPIVYDKVLDSCTKPLRAIFVNKSDTIYRQMIIYFGDGDSIVTANKYNDTIVHFYKTAGRLPFAVKGIDALRFSAWLTDTLLVSAAPVKADFFINSTIGCQYTSLQLNDISKTDTVAQAGNMWHWDFGDGNDTILYSIGLPNGKGSIGHIYNQTGSYSIKLIYNNGYCTDTFISPQQIYISPAPIQGFEINKKISCVPFNLKTSDTSSLAVKRRYIWGDGKDTIITGIYNQSKPAHIYINTGEYTVKQLLSSVNGCTAIDSINISVRAAYKINLGNDTTLCPNNTLILKNIVKDASYLWSNGSTDSMLIVNKRGLYKLTVTLGDCKESDSIQINYYDKGVCDDHINVYPNPFYDKISFSGFLYNACNIDVFVYDMTGRLIKSGYIEHTGGFVSFNLGDIELSSGIYLINVVTPKLNIKNKMLGIRNW